MYVTDRFAPERYDCFVVGSGPAGVSLALALAERKKRVLIFESGDEDKARTELSTRSATATTPVNTGTDTGCARSAARRTSGLDGARHFATSTSTIQQWV